MRLQRVEYAVQKDNAAKVDIFAKAVVIVTQKYSKLNNK